MTERHSPCGESAANCHLWERVTGHGIADTRFVTDAAETKRRYRAGIRSQDGAGHAALVPREPPRNGIPWKPYRYHGLGYDLYEGPEAVAS